LPRWWENTRKVSEIVVKDFDAIIIVAGGRAPVFTYDKATDLLAKFVEFSTGKVAAALCHGVAILRDAKLLNGEVLAKGKTVTSFANVEEDFAGNAMRSMNLLSRDKHIMQWRIETS
jgi:putative intracellular protease/amidase